MNKLTIILLACIVAGIFSLLIAIVFEALFIAALCGAFILFVTIYLTAKMDNHE